MNKHHDVQQLVFENDTLHISIDGVAHIFALADISPRLLAASSEERERYEISPSGYGIHWPLIDEDLSIDSLLGIKRLPMSGKGRIAV